MPQIRNLLRELRELATLRRIAKAEERQANALETLARTAYDWWRAQHPARLGKGKSVDFGLATFTEIDESTAERLDRERYGNFDDEAHERERAGEAAAVDEDVAR